MQDDAQGELEVLNHSLAVVLLSGAPCPTSDLHAACSQGHTGPIASVAFCPVDSKVLATGSWDKTIKIWELTSLGRCKATLKVRLLF